MANILPANAAAAYAATAANKLAPAAGVDVGAAASAATGKPDFSSLIEDALGSVREATGKAEVQATKAIEGDAPLHDVVAAVSNAELTLQTVVAVRDRVIAAYQDIIRMPI